MCSIERSWGPISVRKSRNSLYFSLFAGNLRRKVRARLFSLPVFIRYDPLNQQPVQSDPDPDCGQPGLVARGRKQYPAKTTAIAESRLSSSRLRAAAEAVRHSLPEPHIAGHPCISNSTDRPTQLHERKQKLKFGGKSR